MLETPRETRARAGNAPAAGRAGNTSQRTRGAHATTAQAHNAGGGGRVSARIRPGDTRDGHDKRKGEGGEAPVRRHAGGVRLTAMRRFTRTIRAAGHRLRGGMETHGVPGPVVMVRGVMLLAALAGGIIATGAFTSAAGNGAAGKSHLYSINQNVPISFGSVAVESAERSQGLTAEQLSGVTHGIQNNIGPDQVQVQVVAALSNTTDAVITYGPDQFELVTDTDKQPVLVNSSSFTSTVLAPHSRVEGTLTFVTSIEAKKLLLRYTDLVNGQPVVIDLGKPEIVVTQ